MKKLILIATLLFLASCSYRIRFVDWGGGPPLKGMYNELTPAIEVTMPDGEKLSGDDVPYTGGFLGKDSLFFLAGGPLNSIIGVKPYTASAISVRRYARLVGNRGTVMEILFRYNTVEQKGFGWAKTNKGHDYDVFFSHAGITAESK